MESRVYERHPCDVPTICQPAAAREMEELRWTATISDISQGGVSIRLHRRFERGACLAIELPGDAQRESAVVFVKVVHVRRADDGRWALGCRFVSVLSDDEVQRLLTCDHYVLSSDPHHGDENVAVDDTAKANSGPIACAEAPSSEFKVTPFAARAHVLGAVALEIEIGEQAPIRCRIKRLDVTNCWPLAPGKILNIHGAGRDGVKWSIKLEVLQLFEHADGWILRGRLAKPAADSGLVRVLRRLTY